MWHLQPSGIETTNKPCIMADLVRFSVMFKHGEVQSDSEERISIWIVSVSKMSEHKPVKFLTAHVNF